MILRSRDRYLCSFFVHDARLKADLLRCIINAVIIVFLLSYYRS